MSRLESRRFVNMLCKELQILRSRGFPQHCRCFIIHLLRVDEGMTGLSNHPHLQLVFAHNFPLLRFEVVDIPSHRYVSSRKPLTLFLRKPGEETTSEPRIIRQDCTILAISLRPCIETPYLVPTYHPFAYYASQSAA
jgi:hypothetical protein